MRKGRLYTRWDGTVCEVVRITDISIEIECLCDGEPYVYTRSRFQELLDQGMYR